MLNQQLADRENVKLPKITHKSKSVPGTAKHSSTLLDSVSAKSWLYCTPNIQYGSKSTMKRQIASLTKIMTCICALEISEKYNMNMKTTYFKVTDWAADTSGTSALLQENAWVTIQDLLYGLMLPSGNDAAIVLAQNLGAVLYFDKVGNKSLIEEIRSIDLSEDYQSIKFYMQEFVAYMNIKAKGLKMFKTKFANCHGLDHVNNFSCCEDVYLMSAEAMKGELFRKIVKSISYKAIFKFFRDGKVICKPVIWSNTNKLLQKNQVYGIKTGITNRAGGCLATAFNLENSQAFIIVLGSTSQQSRFKDTLKIMNWASDQSLSTNAG